MWKKKKKMKWKKWLPRVGSLIRRRVLACNAYEKAKYTKPENQKKNLFYQLIVCEERGRERRGATNRIQMVLVAGSELDKRSSIFANMASDFFCYTKRKKEEEEASVQGKCKQKPEANKLSRSMNSVVLSIKKEARRISELTWLIDAFRSRPAWKQLLATCHALLAKPISHLRVLVACPT